jgi:hypothetical protein
VFSSFSRMSVRLPVCPERLIWGLGEAILVVLHGPACIAGIPDPPIASAVPSHSPLIAPQAAVLQWVLSVLDLRKVGESGTARPRAGSERIGTGFGQETSRPTCDLGLTPDYPALARGAAQ